MKKKQYRIAYYYQAWKEAYIDADSEQEARDFVESWPEVLGVDKITELEAGESEGGAQ
jgi:hypothetical protein